VNFLKITFSFLVLLLLTCQSSNEKSKRVYYKKFEGLKFSAVSDSLINLTNNENMIDWNFSVNFKTDSNSIFFRSDTSFSNFNTSMAFIYFSNNGYSLIKEGQIYLLDNNFKYKVIRKKLVNTPFYDYQVRFMSKNLLTLMILSNNFKTDSTYNYTNLMNSYLIKNFEKQITLRDDYKSEHIIDKIVDIEQTKK
jgi:hypothetical protein